MEPKGAGLGAIGDAHALSPTVLSTRTVFSEVQMQYRVGSTHSELDRPKPPRPGDTQNLRMPGGDVKSKTRMSGLPQKTKQFRLFEKLRM